jgi:hypothetical protein
VLEEFKISMKTLQKNYQKWCSEYNTILLKIAQRDKIKDKNDQYDYKITEAQNEKYRHRNNSSAIADLDLKLARLNKEAEAT